MKEVTFDQFIKDYNFKYKTYYGFIATNTLEIESIISAIYNCNDFELNFEDEIIELYE